MSDIPVDLWKEKLIATKSGAIKPLLANAIISLRESYKSSMAGALAYDTFARETLLIKQPPWDNTFTEWQTRAWTPQDDLLATNWCQRHGVAVNSATMAQAVEAVAHDQECNPVLDYLGSLQHDNTPRLDLWLSTYLGASQNDYTATVGRCALIAAVARIHNPGCKVDTMPILEGPQGARKSTAIKTLFDPWFTDELADLGSKDAAMQTAGVWGIEVSELDAMSRGEISKIKAFISRTTDRFRPPYGARTIESPRSCVFWGTTNSEGYLKDETGGRRFWPVRISKIDVEGLRDAREQLWAEAVVLYSAGVPWWITNPKVLAAAEHQQSDRYAGDPWDEEIAAYVGNESEVSIRKIIQSVLGIEMSRRSVLEQTRVARILRSLGFTRHQRRTGGVREWVYIRPVSPESVAEFARPFDNVTTFPAGDARKVVTA